MSTSKGNYYENKAADFLESEGHIIIECNFYAKKLGEIDIITLKDDVYHFVEVKSGETFEAIYNITPSKLHKLLRSVQYYLKYKNLDVTYCIDAIIYAGNEIEYLENITL
ncbi:MAG TPA: YraN family protein [Arcobacter sp.]|nr:YraN family protein [Arcobacter sp.]